MLQERKKKNETELNQKKQNIILKRIISRG